MKIIIKLGDHYLEWSSVHAAPATMGMSRAEFSRWARETYGAQGTTNLEARLDRADATGTSAHGMNVRQVVGDNRAGPDGAQLTTDEIHRAYCLQQPIRDGWTPSVGA